MTKDTSIDLQLKRLRILLDLKPKELAAILFPKDPQVHPKDANEKEWQLVRDCVRGKGNLGRYPLALKNAAITLGVCPISLVGGSSLRGLLGARYTPAWFLAWTYVVDTSPAPPSGWDLSERILQPSTARFAHAIASALQNQFEPGDYFYTLDPPEDDADDWTAEMWAQSWWGHLGLIHGESPLNVRDRLALKWCEPLAHQVPIPSAPTEPLDWQGLQEHLLWVECLKLLRAPENGRLGLSQRSRKAKRQK